LLIAGCELRFLSDIKTLPTNFFGLVRPQSLRSLRPNRPHQLVGNVNSCSEMLQLAAGDKPAHLDTLSFINGGKIGAPASQVYAFGGKVVFLTSKALAL